MKHDTFSNIFAEQLNLCEDIMIGKGREYNPGEDRLKEFKIAAALKNVTPRQALAGMMLKHTISIYGMVDSDEEFSIEKWNEKITDHINYLILLKAVVSEEMMDPDQLTLPLS